MWDKPRFTHTSGFLFWGKGDESENGEINSAIPSACFWDTSGISYLVFIRVQDTVHQNSVLPSEGVRDKTRVQKAGEG